MRRAFALGTVLQTLAATAVIFLATTAVAQENQQPNEEKPDANTQQTERSEADQEGADADEKETVVLKVIEFKAMAVNDFLAAAQVAGVVDRRTAYSAPRQRVGAQQGTNDQKRLYLGVKPNSSLLFVRGLEKEVNKVEALAKKLDKEPDQMPETLRFENGKQARRIPQADLTDIKELLGSLGLKTSTAVLGGANFLVIEESDETNVKQIEQVLEKLSETRDKGNAKGDGEQESQGKEEPAEGDAEETKDQPEKETDQETEEQEADTEKDQ